MVLFVINQAAEQAVNETASFRYLAMLAVIITLFFISQKYILQTSMSEIERILHKVRVRLGDMICRSDLLPLEHIGRSVIYSSISKETLTISQAAAALMLGCQSVILVVFAMLYVAWLSTAAFVVAVLFIALAISVHMSRQTKINADLHEALEWENRVMDAMTDMLSGFKEMKMSSARSAELFAHLQATSDTVVEVKTRVQNNFAVHITYSQMIFYLMLGCMVFLVPRLSATYPDVVIKVTSAVMFIVGPISAAVTSVPLLNNANAACESIYRLEAALSQSMSREKENHLQLKTFEAIHFEGVMFQYVDPTESRRNASIFTIGPIDLSIRKGELIFIAGGNGSGKSTLLRLLTALYYPNRGTIRLDRMVLSDANYIAYRDLFSVVFADYHLFRRLYGIHPVDPNRVAELLHDLGLEDKTSLVNGEFDTLELSSGQRKRLAMLIVLLEDKPILAFDEWAADQDPEFRRRFYEEILPQLKAQGKTIIAATHDDRYFHVADRVIRMEEGQIVAG